MSSGLKASSVFFLVCWVTVECKTYVLDDTPGLGRVFDGIGGISGGGATSRLLVSYPKRQRDEILDYLFKPKFGASLHMLKVEVGGDAQSTDGTEPSHMHTPDDQNYYRGYEWWMMTEAKKRNPDIKLYGLPWAYPAWVGQGENTTPFTHPTITATYMVNWIQGAKATYNLTIDYIGIWNERGYDATYIKTLRSMMDENSLQQVQIVAADGHLEPISGDVTKDHDLAKAISIMGYHYPGTATDDNAMKTGKPLWASEDYSTFNDDVGAGCWARTLNQNYVNGYLTSTISWNLIASYYDGLPWFRCGLMTAVEPWSGHYDVNGPIWVTAHTTQFTWPGLQYLQHGNGVGFLDGGGSYVTFFDSVSHNFTIVIETMSHDQSVCTRPPLPAYNVSSTQAATFELKGNLESTTSLNLWKSDVAKGNYFFKMDPIKVQDGLFSINLDVDCVYTLSTLTGQAHSAYQDVPQSQTFPVPYKDDFNSYKSPSEAAYFADQTGVFEITSSAGEQYMRQVITERPIESCPETPQPITVIGNISWYTVTAEVSVRLEQANTSAFLCVSYMKGACTQKTTTGVYAAISANSSWAIYGDQELSDVLASGEMPVKTGQWYRLRLEIADGTVQATFGDTVEKVPIPDTYSGGFVGFGTGSYYPAQFDDFVILKASPAEIYL